MSRIAIFSETHVVRDKFLISLAVLSLAILFAVTHIRQLIAFIGDFYMTGRQDIVVSNDQIQVIVNRQNSQRPQQLYRNLQRLGIRNVHFIPLLEHDRNGMLTEDSLCSADWGAVFK